MSEATKARGPLSRRLRAAGAHVQNIEDAYSAGIPDTNYCLNGYEGWVECKFVAAWPKREATPVRVKFRPGQVPWLVKRAKAGGHCYVLLAIADTVLLFDGADASDLEDGCTAKELVGLSLCDGWGEIIKRLGGEYERKV